MILTLKMVKLLVNLFDAALNDMMNTLNCFDITIISVMLMISTNSPRSFVVPVVMSFSTIQVISTGTWKLAKNEWKMSIQEVFILCGKHHLRSLTTSQSLIQKIIPSSEILSSSTSKQYVFNQWKSITQRHHHGLVLMYLYRYQFLQIFWTNQFYAKRILIISSYLL